MRVRVNDPERVPDLRRHLAQQGFPASVAGADELEVLFPGHPSIFAAAAELDLWQANHAVAIVTVRLETAAR